MSEKDSDTANSTTSSTAVIHTSHLPYASTFTKFQVWKNLIVVSFAFMFLFTSFQGLANLQSSLNKDEGLGPWGLAVIYGSLIVSCMFLPTVIIWRLGCKWTIVASMACYILYMVANFYAKWGTMMPSSVIVGLGAAPLWSAKCAYLTETGIHYAKMMGETSDAVVNRFFGVFFAFFQTSQVWGNLISSFVLETGRNATNISEDVLATCGANYCTGDEEKGNETNTNLDRPIDTKIYIMCGIYVACGIAALSIVAIFLDPLVLEKKNDSGRDEGKFSFRLFFATFRHLRAHLSQVLIIPLTFYSGLEQGFIGADYTKAFVSCNLGIWMVGFVMICFGVTDAICSFLFGRLVKYTGRIFFFVLGALIHISLQIALLMWQPHPDYQVVFFVLAGLWGMSDAIWQTQLNSLYGVLFSNSQEAAFSNYRLWESLGFAIAYIYSNYLCVNVKIYILMAVLALGMLGYFTVEITERRKAKSSSEISKE